jgi:hypothetical protein
MSSIPSYLIVSHKNMTSSKKRCIICGCQDHKLIGCINHKAKKCSCYQS